jgi:hypothetical protein
MIELQTSVTEQDDTTRTRTPKPGYLNLSGVSIKTQSRNGCTYLDTEGLS